MKRFIPVLSAALVIGFLGANAVSVLAADETANTQTPPVAADPSTAVAPAGPTAPVEPSAPAKKETKKSKKKNKKNKQQQEQQKQQ